MPASTLAIVNPASGSGATGRRWPRVEPLLRDALGPLEVEHTRGPRDAARIAREAVRSGVQRIVVAGGDGTGSEVASGLLGADLGDYVEVALLPLGSGCDFARALGLSRIASTAIAAMVEGDRRRVDAGRASYVGRSGEERTSHFLNVASMGISGLTDELVNQASKRFGPRLAFAIGTVRAILGYRPAEVEITVDGAPFYRGVLSLATAANGRFFGSGMAVAPDARVDDGALDVVVVGDMSKAQLISAFPSIYRGTHLSRPAVTQTRGRVVEARVVDPAASVLIDVDGEPLGHLPARFEVLPGAISMFGLPHA